MMNDSLNRRKRNKSLITCIPPIRVFPVAQTVKNLPATHETWVQSLGQENPLKKGMTVHSSILAWRIPWREEPGRLQDVGSQRVGHDWATNTTYLLLYTWELPRQTKWINKWPRPPPQIPSAAKDKDLRVGDGVGGSSYGEFSSFTALFLIWLLYRFKLELSSWYREGVV